MAYTHTHDGVTARWVGALHVEHGGRGVLFGAPSGVAERLGPAVDRLDAVVLPSGRVRALAGLVPLLAARTAARPLTVAVLLGEPRAAALVDAFARGWPDRVSPTVDVVAPGQAFVAGVARVITRPARVGELHAGAVEAVAGCGLRAEVGPMRVAVLARVAPSSGWRAFAAGAHVVVAEVGVRPWPSSGGRWRMSVSDAIGAATRAERLWLLGDDGRPVEIGEA